MAFYRRTRAFALPMFLAIIAPTGCKERPDPPATIDAGPAPLPAEATVPAPDGLAVEGTIRSCDALLAAVRALSPLAPESARPLIADFIAVDAKTAMELLTSEPAHFAMTSQGKDTGFVLAIPIRDARATANALRGSGLVATDDAETGLTTFVAKGDVPAGRPKNQVIGLRRNFLLAASSETALRTLTPYLTRTMPTRALLKGADDLIAANVPQSAMRTSVKQYGAMMLALAKIQRKAAHDQVVAMIAAGVKGSPAGLYDLIAEDFETVSGRELEWLSEAGDFTVRLSTSQGGLRLRADLAAPNPASPLAKHLAALSVSNARALLDLPASTVIGATIRSSVTERAESSRDIVQMVSALFGKELDDAAKSLMTKFFVAWDAARTDLSSVAIVYEGTETIGLVGALGATDGAELATLTRHAFDAVLGVSGVAAGLKKEGIGPIKIATETIASVPATVVTMPMPSAPKSDAGGAATSATTAKKDASRADTAEIAFAPGHASSGDELWFGAGVGGRALLARMVAARAGKSLADAAPLATFTAGLGDTNAVAALLLPSRAVPALSGAAWSSPGPTEDAIALTFGRSATGAFLSLDLTRGGLTAVAAILQSLEPKKTP